MWLYKFREIGDVVSSFDPVHLALPWAGIRFILQCTIAHQETMLLVMETTEQAALIIHRGQVYELLYNNETSLESALVELYTALLLMHIQMGKFLAGSNLHRISQALWIPRELQNLLLDIEAKEKEVIKEAAICQSRQVTRINARC